MQLVPETAIRHGVRNLYDTNENVTGGAKHLRYLLNRFHGNIRLALAAYNAGERKVDRYGQIPPYKETQDYVKRCSSTIGAIRRTVGSCRLQLPPRLCAQAGRTNRLPVIVCGPLEHCSVPRFIRRDRGSASVWTIKRGEP